MSRTWLGPFVRLLRQYVVVSVFAMVLAVFVRTWFLQAFVVPSGSMAPTLRPGDHLLVNKFVAQATATTRLLPARAVRRGDVLVFRDPRRLDRLLVKRCVGVPGDRIELIDKRLWINDTPREESYARFDDQVYPPSRFLDPTLRARDNFGPVTLGAGEIFCLGDDRDISLDSRHWGPLPIRSVIGRAALVYRHRERTVSEREEAEASREHEDERSVPRWVR